MNEHENPDSRPPGVLLEPAGPVHAAVIWLHGLGADGHDFEPLVPLLDPPVGVRFYFPHAPRRPISINGGMRMRGWYDIRASWTDEDDAGIRASGEAVLAMVAYEMERGITPERIVLAGFSQGGAIALHAGLRFSGRLGGILALSTYLPLAAHLGAEAHPASRDTPLLMAHGLHDEIIPIGMARHSADALRAAGHPPEWHEFPTGHGICPEEIPVISAWLRRTLPPKSEK